MGGMKKFKDVSKWFIQFLQHRKIKDKLPLDTLISCITRKVRWFRNKRYLKREIKGQSSGEKSGEGREREDVLLIRKMSYGFSRLAWERITGHLEHIGVVQPKRGNATSIVPRDGPAVAGLSFSLFLSPVPFRRIPRRVSLWYVTEIHRENYVTNALGYISRKCAFRVASARLKTPDVGISVSLSIFSKVLKFDSYISIKITNICTYLNILFLACNLHLCTDEKHKCKLNER